jgi:multiple sugar transport system permease protein
MNQNQFEILITKKRFLPWLTILPALVVIFLIMIYPIIYNFFISFRYLTLVNLRTNGVFVGFQNYAALLQDEAFIRSLMMTLRYVALTVLLQIVIAYWLAMLTYHNRTFLRRLVTICLLLPKMVTPSAIALIWRLILNYETGIINYFMQIFGLTKVAFLTDTLTAMLTLSVIGVWQNVGFSYLLILAGLMSMPYEMIEASFVDGASLIRRFQFIILPYLKQVLTVVVLFAVMGAFQTFDTIYTTTGGGPGDATRVASLFLYSKLMMSGKLGEAASISVFLLFISLCISIVLVLMLNKGREK